jgi:hypothetical protein
MNIDNTYIEVVKINGESIPIIYPGEDVHSEIAKDTASENPVEKVQAVAAESLSSPQENVAAASPQDVHAQIGNSLTLNDLRDRILPIQQHLQTQAKTISESNLAVNAYIQSIAMPEVDTTAIHDKILRQISAVNTNPLNDKKLNEKILKDVCNAMSKQEHLTSLQSLLTQVSPPSSPPPPLPVLQNTIKPLSAVQLEKFLVKKAPYPKWIKIALIALAVSGIAVCILGITLKMPGLIAGGAVLTIASAAALAFMLYKDRHHRCLGF